MRFCLTTVKNSLNDELKPDCLEDEMGMAQVVAAVGKGCGDRLHGEMKVS